MMLFFNLKFVKDLFLIKCLRGSVSNLRFQNWNTERSLTVITAVDNVSIISVLNAI